jgi:uncharacterized protein YkwD
MLFRGTLVTLVATFSLVLLPAVGAHAADVSGSCPGADAHARDTTLKKQRAAVLCLLNGERSTRGLGTLSSCRSLARAASKQSRSMIRHGYFGHQRPGGPDFAERIKLSGYASGAGGFEAAENIAWGAGERSTPAAIVASWMASSDHRHNVLAADFKQIGIGIARGVPDGSHGTPGELTDAMVVTADFGTRL